MKLRHKIAQRLLGGIRQAKISYSQCGEDLIIALALKEGKINNPTYLEIGAHHPTLCSNTYLLYLKGFRGTLIEANPALIQKIKQIRPEDRVINCAVGVKSGVAEFTIASHPGISSLEQIEGKKISVSVITLADCIKRTDVVSIDTEGTDEAIIKAYDFSYKPYLFVVETDGNPRIAEHFLNNGYKIYAHTKVNTIFTL